MEDWKKLLRRTWKFIWEDDSVWSWIVNVILAFVLIKFIVYPGLGFLLNTTHPVVAVVSESMEHRLTPRCAQMDGYCMKYQYEICGRSHSEKKPLDFDGYWSECGSWYESNSIASKEDFYGFTMHNGFNKGDIIVLRGKKPGNVNVGDIIVFWSARRDPIIHRVVRKLEQDNVHYFQTKGDHNPGIIRTPMLDESRIREEQVIGSAYLRIPYLGYIKIMFVDFINFLRGLIQ